MIEQLEALDIDDWPRALAKYLRKSKTDVHDITFQSQVLQADISYNSK